MARRETEAPAVRAGGTRKRSANCYSLALRQGAPLIEPYLRAPEVRPLGRLDLCSF